MPASRSSALTGAEGLTGRVSTFSIPAEHILGSTMGLPQRPFAPRGRHPSIAEFRAGHRHSRETAVASVTNRCFSELRCVSTLRQMNDDTLLPFDLPSVTRKKLAIDFACDRPISGGQLFGADARYDPLAGARARAVPQVSAINLLRADGAGRSGSFPQSHADTTVLSFGM
jgi:hypothetical protein